MTTLVVAPPAFGLPSANLECIAVESLLLFGDISHAVLFDNDPTLPRKLKSRFSSSAAKVAASDSSLLPVPFVFDACVFSQAGASVAACEEATWVPDRVVDLAMRASKLDDGLSDDNLATTAAFTALTRNSMIPAIEFLIRSCVEDFTALLAGSGANSGIWARLVDGRSTIRTEALRRLSIAGGFAGVNSAVAAVERGCLAIEKMLKKRNTSNNANNNASSEAANSSTTFFFGFSKPTSADAFVFTALVAALGGKYSEANPLRPLQNSDRFALCRKYVEHCVKTFFSPASKTAGLTSGRFIDVRVIEKKSKKDEEDDPFAPGRDFTIKMTVVVTLTFILASNFSLIRRWFTKRE